MLLLSWEALAMVRSRELYQLWHTKKISLMITFNLAKYCCDPTSSILAYHWRRDWKGGPRLTSRDRALVYLTTIQSIPYYPEKPTIRLACPYTMATETAFDYPGRDFAPHAKFSLARRTLTTWHLP